MVLTTAEWSVEFAGDDLRRLSVKRGWFRHGLVVAGPDPLRLRGLRRRDAIEVDAALELLISRHVAKPAITAAFAWYRQAQAVASAALAEGRWIPGEAVDRLRAAHPGEEAVKLLRRVLDAVAGLGPRWRRAVDFLEVDLSSWVAGHNERILADEAARHAAFFDTVESKPLTDEQVRAVVCLDNRVHVVAAAGSGKTSVMVARAAYAIMRGFVQPDRVLLLAFNRDAADELKSRVTARLRALGLPVEGVTATTFHAFGLRIIGEATGRKPRPAPWLDAGRDVKTVGDIVDELRDRSSDFAYRWDLFRLLYPRPLETPDGGEPDGYDRETGSTGYRTAAGEIVKSEGERVIADWLFFNGVTYEYERPYSVDVADAGHTQYQPDFYYPDVDVWHEHWALDHNGRPPPEFVGYAESMRWKKELHQKSGTKLIETTWAEILGSEGLERLGQALQEHGVKLEWNPDRHVPGLKPLRHEDLSRLVRTFMAHVKSNVLARDDIDQRLADRSSNAGAARTRLFLELYWQIHDEWQARLRSEDAVDFEDMLAAAAMHLEAGDTDPGYDLVMVDEFQDASQARARVVRGLVQKSGRYLLAVGDDWQSINRFAGADMSVMTRFEEWFGSGLTLRLQTTFRCPQTIADTASGFVTKNPRQLKKSIVSALDHPGEGVRLCRAQAAEVIPKTIAACINEIAGRVARGEEPVGRDGHVSVFVLGRYRFERDLMPRGRWESVQVTFRTAHSSKGLEADYVIVANMGRGRYGFPSNIEDDPVLNLVMADPDLYPHSEERRLLYVALTRARRGVMLIAAAGQESPFVVELLDEDRLVVQGAKADGAVRVCPTCNHGTLVLRTGRYGQFYGCSTFPTCRHTEKLDRARSVARPPF